VLCFQIISVHITQPAGKIIAALCEERIRQNNDPKLIVDTVTIIAEMLRCAFSDVSFCKRRSFVYGQREGGVHTYCALARPDTEERQHYQYGFYSSYKTLTQKAQYRYVFWLFMLVVHIRGLNMDLYSTLTVNMQP
jgi:hypothetical protein